MNTQKKLSKSIQIVKFSLLSSIPYRYWVHVQMSQVETRKIFLFMNVKRFKRYFSAESFYIQLYTKKSLGSGNLNSFFRICQVTGNRGTFFWPHNKVSILLYGFFSTIFV